MARALDEVIEQEKAEVVEEARAIATDILREVNQAELGKQLNKTQD